MTECFMCKKPVDPASGNTGGHKECWAVALERETNGFCTGCGKNTIKCDGMWCIDCEEKPFPYQDYPGPQ